MFATLVVVAAMSLFAGCASDGRRVARSGKAGGSTTEQVSPKDLESRVEAYTRFSLGVSHEMRDEPAKALDEYYKSALADPGNEELAVEVSRRLIRGRKSEQAVELLTKMSKLPNASGMIYVLLGAAYAELGKTDQAIAASRTAVTKLPKSPLGYQNLMQIYLTSSRFKEALEVVELAAKQTEVDAEFLVDLAELYMRYTRVRVRETESLKPRMLALLERAEKLNPTDTSLLVRLGDGYQLCGDTKRAAQMFLKVLEKEPKMPTVREKLTDLYLRSGQRENAAEQLTKLARENPTNPQAWYVLGSLAVDRKDFTNAVSYYEKALLLNPNFEPVYYELAAARLAIDQSEDALKLLQRARGLFGANFVVEFYTSLAYSHRKEYPEAIKYLTSAEMIARTTETNRLTPNLYFQLGSVFERNKDYSEAEKYFRKSIELAPDFAESLNYLGYMWAERGTNLVEAQQFIQRALKIEPDNGAFLDSLGWVLFKLGKTKEALPPILRAVELTKEPDATLYDHLGDIYAKLKQPAKARDAWKKSLSIEANPEIEKKLKALPVKSGP